MKRFATITISLIASVYIGASGYMYAAQESLIFKPSNKVQPVEKIFPGALEHQINTPDGERLQLWYKTATPNQPTLVYLHGNAGNLSTRQRLIEALSADGRGLVIFSWRGFGQSSGQPSELGLYQDARAVFDWLATQNLPSEQLFVYAESLGTGVATQMASERDFAGVILAAPYTSIAEMAKLDYPWLPVDLLLEHRFDSLSRIQSVNEPMVILHSRDDRVIPFQLGEKLAKASPEHTKFQGFTDRGHTGFTKADIDSAMAWLRSQAKSSP